MQFAAEIEAVAAPNRRLRFVVLLHQAGPLPAEPAMPQIWGMEDQVDNR